MVIVGGAGNNWGAVFGALLIYITWMISDPLSQWLFNNVSNWSTDMGWGAIPESSHAPARCASSCSVW
jgi:branched-chain amino acid transport system permease protein